jgi:hypothetical protein
LVLPAGTPYTLVAAGSVGITDPKYSGGVTFQCDAEYEWNPVTNQPVQSMDNGVDLGVNATTDDGSGFTDVDWGAYSPNHQYQATLISDGNPLDLKLFDTFYADNSAGNLTVDVFAAVPLVTVAKTSDAVEAGLTPGSFTVSRNGDTTLPLTVSYTVSGSARPGVDYTALTGTVTIPAGSATAPIPVTPIDDSNNEVGEPPNPAGTVTLNVSPNYATGFLNSATVAIAESDPVVNLTISGVATADQKTIGAFIALNNNFDARNKNAAGQLVPDNQNYVSGPRIVASDPQLRSATLKITSPVANTKGSWVLTFPDKIQVWQANANGSFTLIKSGQASAQATLPLTLNLLLSGVVASTAPKDVDLKASFTDTAKESAADDALVTVVDVNINLTGVARQDQETVGKFVNIDQGFFSGNKNAAGQPVPDNQDDVSGPRLVPAGNINLGTGELVIQGPTGQKGTWTLTFPASLRIWTRPLFGNSVLIVSGQASAQVTLPVTIRFYIQGMTHSNAFADIALNGTFTPASTTTNLVDKSKVTVLEGELTSDLNLDGTIDTKDDPLKLSVGAYVAVDNEDVNNTGVVDTAKGMIPGGDPNLKFVQPTILFPMAALSTGTVVLTRSNGQIRVYTSPRKGISANNDSAVLWSDSVASFGPGNGNSTRSYDLTVPAQRTAFRKLIASGLYVEGLGASTGARDTDLGLLYFPLGLNDGPRIDLDHLKFTEIQFNDIRATIPGTPAHTARAGVPPPADETFDTMRAGILRFLTENLANRDLNFASPNALVLMRDAIANMSIVLNYAPINVPIRWTVIRSADDAAALGAGVPAIAPVAGQPASNETLNTDQVGSFLVSAYVDVNNLGRYVAGDPRTFLPLILANAQVVRNDTATHAGNIRISRDRGAGGVWIGNSVTTGTFNIANPGAAGIHLSVRVRLTGGGPNGRRGLDRVFGGWINNETAAEDVGGNYTGGHVTNSVFATNRGMATGAGNTFLPGNPAPAIAAVPFLDSGRANVGTGGQTATLGQSRMNGATNVALGQEVTVEAVDSPGQGDPADPAVPPGYPRVDPGFPTIPDGLGGMVPSRLTRVRFNLTFNAFLSFWTNATSTTATPQPGATGAAADRLYSVLLEQPWQIRAEWNINAAGNAVAVAAPAITAGAAVTRDPLARASATNVEVRPPWGVRLLATDAQRDGRAPALAPKGPHGHVSSRPRVAVALAKVAESRIFASHPRLHHLAKQSAPFRLA